MRIGECYALVCEGNISVRVGFVAGEYPPMQGGVGAFTREVAQAIVQKGHTVSVLTRVGVEQVEGSGIEIAAVVGKCWGWSTLGAAARWIETQQIDIMNIQFQTAAYNMHPAIHWLPRYISAVPVVVTFHDLRTPYLFPKAGPVRTWIVRELAHNADAVIATDRADQKTLIEDWHTSNVCWIPIGSNVTTAPLAGYERGAWRAKLGVQPDDLLISYFGFLNASKGGLVLVRALAYLIEWGIPAYLIMIGGRAGASDPTNVAYGERVDATIERHGLNNRVHWTGFVEDELVSAYFLASDLTALPYLDGVSLRRGTLMAALAHGQAIVTTSPMAEVPELDKVVHVVPPNDAHALAEAILALWNDPPQRKRMGKAAQETARLFSWDRIATQTLALYEELLSR